MARAPLVCNVAGPVVFPSQKVSLFQPLNNVNPNDPHSLARAIQIINNNFQTLVRLGLFNPPDHAGPDGGGVGTQTLKVGDFKENRSLRKEETKRVFNPNDKEQWVDVKQITALTFQDATSGRTWVWKQ